MEDGSGPEGADAYEKLLLLDDLESLVEEIEEAGVETESALRGEMRAHMETLGVSSLAEARSKIVQLHMELDRDDAT